MSKTEIELRLAAVWLMQAQAKEDLKSNNCPTLEMLKAKIRMLDAVTASQAAEKREQEEEGFSA